MESEDAKNLTRALKGSSKAQGGWGEVVLERVLELSGLRKDIEYVAQESQTRDDGSRAMPDVVIQLPEDRRLVVDAKVNFQRCPAGRANARLRRLVELGTPRFSPVQKLAKSANGSVPRLLNCERLAVPS